MDIASKVYLTKGDFHPRPSIKETMEALNDLVQTGKVRALGASAMHASQFQDMQKVAQDNGWNHFSAMENHYNLLYREDEKDLAEDRSSHH